MWAILLQKVKMGVGTEEKVKMGTKEKVKMGFDTEKKVDLKVDSEKSKEADIKTIDIDNIGEKTNICNSPKSRGLTDNLRQGLASEEVGEEKTGLLKKLKIWVDKDKYKVKNKRKQIGRLQKSKPHRLQVFGGPTMLRPRHRTAKRAKVLLDFGQSKGWVKKVKKFRRQRQGGEQREKQKQEVAKAKVVAWLQGIEIEDWKSQMLHVLDRAV